VNRCADAAFSALAELDPIAAAQRTERVDPLTHSDDLRADRCVARIVAVPRPNPQRIDHVSTDLRRSGGSLRGRSPCSVIGLAISAAVAVAATLLWVSPSAGAPSQQAATTPTHAAYAAAKATGTTALP
jgi:hypothetical protein